MIRGKNDPHLLEVYCEGPKGMPHKRVKIAFVYVPMAGRLDLGVYGLRGDSHLVLDLPSGAVDARSGDPAVRLRQIKEGVATHSTTKLSCPSCPINVSRRHMELMHGLRLCIEAGLSGVSLADMA